MPELFRREVAFGEGRRPSAGESIAELFHENTKLVRSTAVDPRAEAGNYGLRELEAMSRAYKRYRLHPHVPLPPIPANFAGPAFAEVIAARRSRRTFGPEQLSLNELSAILQWSYGITGGVEIPGGGVQHYRAVPSAGALYPAEIYLGVRDVQGLGAGIYHYEVTDTSLALLSRGDPSEQLYKVCCEQEFARGAATVVLISGVIQRSMRKYGGRGYRLVLLDIGHLGENFYLACTALGLSIVTTTGFFDDEVADLLGIDGCDEAVFYVAFIGRTQTGEL